MLGSGRRQHAVRSRLRDLEALDRIGTRKWMLHHLSDRALDAMASARRIRIAANNTGVRIGANPAELEAMCIVTQNLMATARITGSGGGVA
jgi:mevalonate kinase